MTGLRVMQIKICILNIKKIRFEKSVQIRF